MYLELLFALIVSLCTLAGFYFWFKCIHGKSYLDRPAQWIPIGLLDVLIALIAWAMLPAFAAKTLMATWGKTKLSELEPVQLNVLTLTIGMFSLLACCATAIFISKKHPEFRKVIGTDTSSALLGLKYAAMAFVMVVPFLLGLQWVLSFFEAYEHLTIEQLTENFTTFTLVTTWFTAVVAAPICEEFFFRGVLQTWLHRVRIDGSSEDTLAQITGGPDSRWQTTGENPVLNVWQWWLPIVVTSFFFAVVHIGQGLAPISLFFFSLALGCLYRKTGNIIPSILLHFMLNAFSMFWITINQVIKQFGT